MIAAKNQNAQIYLQKQFSDKKVIKDYVALVVGKPEPDEAHIIAALTRNPSIPQQFKVAIEGKHAETIYKVEASNKAVTRVLLHPLTGRTHQLRIHMQHIGHPIIGDNLYGTSEGEERMYLHAHSLKIHLPDGAEHTFEAPLPPEFKKRFDRG